MSCHTPLVSGRLSSVKRIYRQIGADFGIRKRLVSKGHDRRRVVVTGMGLVTCLGVGVDHVWHRLINSECGIAALDGTEYEKIPCKIAGRVPRGDEAGQLALNKYVSKSEERTMSLATAYALVAADQALTQARWHPQDEQDRCSTGVAVGMGMVGLEDIVTTGRNLADRGYNKVSPHFVPKILVNMASGNISLKYGFKINNRAASSFTKVAVSKRFLKRGLQRLLSGTKRNLLGMRMTLTGAGTIQDPCQVGAVGLPNARTIRIVHISDTHMTHDAYINVIPAGDILVHSGDFLSWARLKLPFQDDFRTIDKFFSKLPHRYKIFVAGNHDTIISRSEREVTQSLLKNCIYLQDASVVIEGIKFFGSPWTGTRRSSYARAFAVPYSTLRDHWDNVPDDIDVLITHSPPRQIRDQRMGCEGLRDNVLNRIKPQLHLFGHAHVQNGVTFQDGVLFSNAAMKCRPIPRVIDYLVPPGKGYTDVTPKPIEHSMHNTIARFGACMIM